MNPRTEYHRVYYRDNAGRIRPRAAERKRWARLAAKGADSRCKPPAWYQQVADALKSQGQPMVKL